MLERGRTRIEGNIKWEQFAGSFFLFYLVMFCDKTLDSKTTVSDKIVYNSFLIHIFLNPFFLSAWPSVLSCNNIRISGISRLYNRWNKGHFEDYYHLNLRGLSFSTHPCHLVTAPLFIMFNGIQIQ